MVLFDLCFFLRVNILKMIYLSISDRMNLNIKFYTTDFGYINNANSLFCEYFGHTR